MTSQRKIQSNQRNANRSTGPKTEQGKIRSSRNALRHGLAAAGAAMADGALVAQLTASLQEMGLREAESAVNAAMIAETQAYLARIQVLGNETLLAAIHGQRPITTALEEFVRLFRYERRALGKRRKALKQLLVQRAAKEGARVETVVARRNARATGSQRDDRRRPARPN